jgi:conjugative relaxase-like TrwC/TraI family protein
MLSTKPIKNAKHARLYFYEKDNYYFKDSPDAQEHSQWMGRGAEALGLSGSVNPELFEQLLSGKLPSGQQLGKLVKGEVQHRSGYDLTFSAPKSVSLLALVGGDSPAQDFVKDLFNPTLDEPDR